MRRDHARVDDFARDRRGHLQGDERPHEVRIAATATATLSRSARRGDRRGHRVRRVVKLVGEANASAAPRQDRRSRRPRSWAGRRPRGDDGGPRCDDDQRSDEVCDSLAWLRE
jgi:hypothetical protein